MQVHRFKFQVRGAPLTGKFLFQLDEGCELYLDVTFQPFTKDSPHVCFFLRVANGRTFLQFLRPGFIWNRGVAPNGIVELHVGHEIGFEKVRVEILECPEVKLAPELLSSPVAQPARSTAVTKEITRELDISHLRPARDPAPRSVSAPSPRRSPAPGFAGFLIAFALGLGCGAFAMRVHPAAELPLATAAEAAPPPVASEARAPASLSVDPDARAAVETPAAPEAPDVSEADRAQLFAAVEKNRLEEVRALWEKSGAQAQSWLDEEGRTPFARAASLGHLKMVQYFLDQKTDVNARDASDNTALMWAVRHARVKTVAALLKAGADASLTRKDGASARTLAQLGGNAQIAKLLSVQ